LASTEDITELRNLYLRCDDIEKNFCVNIRAYNSAFAFTSMGVKLDEKLANSKDGVYTFRAQDGIYHLIGSLLPIDGILKFLQLYIYDTEFEIANRLYIMPQLRQDILEFIKLMLNQLNPFIINFRSISSYMNIAELCLLIRADHGLDQHVYNKLTALQVAAVWVEGNNSTEYAERGPRDMYQKYQDAIALVQAYGRPNLFITIIYNSWWPKITSKLMSMQILQDRPDLTAKLEELKKDLYIKGILGLLLHIKHLLEQHYKCLNDFDLPTLILLYDLPNELLRLILNELNIPISAEDLEKIRLLNKEQKLIFDTIMESIKKDKPIIIFVDGPA
ncbi:6621_t:CDS:2, partial [Dentiscutata heterogama]